MNTPLLAALLALALLPGCSQLWKGSSSTTGTGTENMPTALKQVYSSGEGDTKPAQPIQETPESAAPGQPQAVDTERLGRKASAQTGLMTPQPPSVAKTAAGGQRQPVLLNIDKGDVAQVTNQIFSSYLKESYVLDPAAKAQLSVYIDGEFTQSELLQVVSQAYRANGLDIVRRGELYVIQPLKVSSSGATIDARDDKRGPNEPLVVVYRLNSLTTAQALKAVKAFVATERAVVEEPLTNSLIFVEEPERARTIIRLLKSLDLNVLKEVGMEIVPLQALTPEDAVKSLEAIVTKLTMFKQGAAGANVAFLPLANFRGVLIVSHNQDLIQAAKQWLAALDIKGQEAGEQIYVRFVENGLAAEIATILAQVYGAEGGSSSSSSKAGEKLVSATDQQSKPTTPAAPGAGAGAGAGLSGPIRIIADETNNAIIIKANPSDYEKISRTIESLDVMPREVMIELVILEVNLTKNLTYGVQWFFRSRADLGGDGRGQAGTSFSVNPISGSLSGSSSGFSAYWSKINGDLGALVNLLEEETTVHVLSTPTLLAADNKEASFTVGGRTPTLSSQSQSTSTSSAVINSVTYVDTGLILNVKPHINSGGVIRLDVEQTIRDVSDTTTAGINSPSFTERKIKTNLVARSGDTVVIGGIITNNKSRSKSGLPVLMDVPVISPLFSTTGRDADRTELLIAVTPRIVRSESNVAVREFTDRLSEIKRFMQENGDKQALPEEPK